MPRIDDTTPLKKKPFKKKSYRPWNLLDEDLVQTEHKPHTNSTQNLAQSSHKLNTNLTQFTKKVISSFPVENETSHKPHTQPHTIADTNLTQTSHKSYTNNKLGSLVGLQREILYFLYTEGRTQGSKVADRQTTLHISESLNIRVGSVKTTIERLIEKGHLIKKEFKNGRAGWGSYEIAETTYRELLQFETSHKPHTNLTQNSHKAHTKVNTQLHTSSLSSSSVINNKNTTTSETQENNSTPLLPPEWEIIDISSLAEIGFSKHHLKQIANQNKLSAVLVQESINTFAFDLKENSKGKALKTNPVNYLMGILRNGIPYSPPSNYESPEKKAMRIYLEKKKEIESKQIALEEELLKSEFNDWHHTLTDEKINEILPEDIKNSTLAPAKIACLRTYFKNEIWPKKRQEIVNEGMGLKLP